MDPVLERISSFAAANGVELVVCEESVPDAFKAPFCDRVGLCAKSRRVFYHDTGDESMVVGLIHELGHLLADPDPCQGPEVDFLGWEKAVAEALGSDVCEAWLQNMADYVLTEDGLEFKKCSDATKDREFGQCLMLGVKARNMDPETKRPMALRGPLAGVPWDNKYLKAHKAQESTQ